jgi:lipopolysaccharide export system permease protein
MINRDNMRIKLLDRYIMLKYAGTFVFTGILFTLISWVIDASQKVESFVNENLSFYQIVFEYYIYFLLNINILLWPLFALISVIFFTSRLAYNSEIISILNAGVSFRRIMLPYLITALAIVVPHLLSNHIFIPIANKKRIHFENQYIYKGNKDYDRSANIHLFISENSKVYVRYFREEDNSISDLRIEEFDQQRLKSVLKAARAQWQEESKTWLISEYKRFHFDDSSEQHINYQDATLDTLLNMRPSDFVRFKNQREMMTTPELRNYIAEERKRGIADTRLFEIEVHRRSADSYTLIILTIIGLAVASRKVRGGMGVHLAVGVSLGASYIVLSKFSVTFAQGNLIPPILGVWIPNILYTFIAWYRVSIAQK